MRRFTATLHQDMTLQFRYGFYAAAAFVLVCWAAILAQVPPVNLSRIMPALVLGNMIINTFYFVGGLVLLERAEGSLLARAVTPLRSGEYIAARVSSLTALTLAENMILVAIFQHGDFDPFAVTVGVIVGAPIFTLGGLIMVLRYHSINEYLMPSVAVSGLLSAPLLSYLAGWKAWPMYLHPMEPALRLLEGGFRPLAAWEWAYAIGYGGLWIAVLAWWAARALRRAATADV